jgi:hypothetical protein
LGDLERQFNGPIPAAARDLARHGAHAPVLLLRARGEATFFATMASAQIRTLRQRRADGSFRPTLVEDLGFYLRRRRAWRRVAAALAANRPAIAGVENEKPRHVRDGASAVMDIPPSDSRPGMMSALS